MRSSSSTVPASVRIRCLFRTPPAASRYIATPPPLAVTLAATARNCGMAPAPALPTPEAECDDHRTRSSAGHGRRPPAAGARLALRHGGAGAADGRRRRHHPAHRLGALDHHLE